MKPGYVTKKTLLLLAKEICGKKGLKNLSGADQHAIAVALHQRHHPYCCSSFGDVITYGYGELDDYGFWEYPLYEKDVVPGKNRQIIEEHEKEAAHAKR
jgi:hypothetical protein